MTTDLILKIIGVVLGACGSVLIAWRAYNILKWVKLTIESHEISLVAIEQILNGKPQTIPMVTGMTNHLDNYDKAWGAKLLIAGFIMMFAGMAFTVISILV